MPKVTITGTITAVTDGTETTDTLVMVGKDMRGIMGSVSGRSYADAMPLKWGQVIAVPAGVLFSLVCSAGKSYPAWKETGFSA